MALSGPIAADVIRPTRRVESTTSNGSYTVDEAANTFTVTVEGASSPVFEGAKRVQTISFQGDTMTLTGSKVDTPEGPISPVNVWKKVQAK